MMETARQQNTALTPLRGTEKRPGDDRVPPVPDHIQGPDVLLLVAEADVQVLMGYDPGNFLAELEPRDLGRLRGITRAAYARRYPVRAPLTNPQCDTLINDLGLDAALASLEHGQMIVQ